MVAKALPQAGSPPPNRNMAEKQSQGLAADCPVCWNPYDNTFRTPKVLHCQHSFCIECLAHLSLVSPAQNRLQCPLCRQPTVLPSDQPVTELPTDDAVLRRLHLEPKHIVLEGRQLCLKEQCKSRYFLRQPRVYTLDLGPVTDPSLESYREPVRPATATTTTTTLPNRSRLWLHGCNPQLRIFTYLMAVILSVSLLLIFSTFWTRQFFWGWG
ncbi:E3 ubiquitin-protein ligase RNF183 [Rhineura floridana]|uniref:E3 ubiquitin-protein ligase RNF183 n=1 Tax=Rhineura floridana TaxID=261503 RepID=UPI002AC82E68|nr:E3 ubiquitin-protein ligase RNF183 [Rhineura floridana]